jgi:hypothetical protein
VTSSTRQSSAITIGLALIAVLFAVLAGLLILDLTAANGNQSPIAGDPPWYNAIATAILDGSIPYIDVQIEHLPGALVPMLLVGGISRVTAMSFEALWPFAMGAAFVVSVAFADRIPSNVDSGRRYLLLSLPLLPLVLFRIEPWLMVWVVASLALAFRGMWPAFVGATFIASMTKGWPIILFALPFRLGRKALAVGGAAATLIPLMAIAMLPGFREGRAFEGIHTETIVGNLILVFRAMAGSDLQLVGVAGAAYTEAGAFAVFANALIGLPFILISAALVLRRKSTDELVQALGVGLMGIILASPLFSSQFLFWLVPFVVLISTRWQRVYVVASIATLLTVILWVPLAPAWSVIVLARNALLIALSIGWTIDLLRSNASKKLPQHSEHFA